MKKIIALLVIVFLLVIMPGIADAQCSICTRTAQQLGEKSAKGLNFGILYLAFTPLAIIGFVAFRLWKKNQAGDSWRRK